MHVRDRSVDLLETFVFVSSVVHRLARSVCVLSAICMNQCENKQDNTLGLAKLQDPLGVIKEDSKTFKKSKVYSFFPHYWRERQIRVYFPKLGLGQ